MNQPELDRIYHGDALTILKTWPDGFVQTCVTSPPYFGLRDYQVAGQIGLEPTPDAYVAKMVEVFREVRRVLRADGTLWLNLGDSYAAAGNGSGSGKQRTNRGTLAEGEHQKPRRPPIGLKMKDLCMVPARVALALQGFAVVPFQSFSAWADELRVAREARDWESVSIVEGKLRAKDLLSHLQDEGWYLRSELIWFKPNCMPESVTDRPTRSHECLFLLSKSERYYYDYEAIREPASEATIRRLNQMSFESQNGGPKDSKEGNRSCRKTLVNLKKRLDKQRGHSRRHAGFNDRWDGMTKDEQMALGRNKRSVWTVATHPFPGAHFATFPPDLIKPCVLAGAPAGGIVMDPFSGSGTTWLVASNLNRQFIGCELNPHYIEMANRRVANEVAQGKLL